MTTLRLATHWFSAKLRQTALIILFSSVIAGAQGMTLEETVGLALKKDPTIKKIYADVMKADGYVGQARSVRRPQLTLSADSGYAYRSRSGDGFIIGGNDLFDRRAGLILEQLIWDNGCSCFRWKDAECRRKATELLVNAQRESTALATVEAYLGVLKARKQIELARQNIVAHRKFHALAKQREGGAGDAADVELALARVNLAETLLKERELDLNQREADFVRYVCTEPVGLSQPKIPTIKCVDDICPKENFHYQAALHQCKAAQLAKAAIRKSYAPRLSVRSTGGYGQDVLGIDGEDKEASALLVMNWNLLEGGRRKAMEKEAEGHIAEQVAIVEETEVLLCRDIKARWADYSTISERVKILEEYSQRLGSTLTLYHEQFELAKRPLLGVLDIENEKISSQMRLVDERYDLALNAYRLLFFGGKLVMSTAGCSYLNCTPECMSLECPGADCIECESPLRASPVPSVNIKAALVATPVEGGEVKKTFKLFQGLRKDKQE